MESSFMDGMGNVSPKANELQELSSMVNVLEEKRTQINLLKEQLSDLEKEERNLSEKEIPAFLKSKDLKSITTDNDRKITIVEKVKASIPKDSIKRQEVMEWVASNDGEGIIKTNLVIESPTDAVIKTLQASGHRFSLLKDIHNSTLVAFLKTLLGMRKGFLGTIEFNEIPESLNPYIYNKTTIK